MRLGKYKRNAESLEREGENLQAVWRPDTKLIAILVSITFFFYILISFMYTIALFMANFDYSRVIYSHTYTYYTICKCMYMVLVESHFRNNVVHVSTFVKILLKLEDRQVSRVSLAS